MFKFKLKMLIVPFCLGSLLYINAVYPSMFLLLSLSTSNSEIETDNILNGNFEDGLHFPGWKLKFLDTGYANIYNATTVQPYSGLNSYYMYGEAQNPGPRGANIEIGQNISITAPLTSNLTGKIYVNQCDSANTYPSWVGIFIDFYNKSLKSLGRIYYQFASVNQGTDFPNEINLYNQLGIWLDLNRNITNDFNEQIGEDFSKIFQLEIVMFIVASDGTQAGNRGYAEAYFDDFSLNIDNIVVNGGFEDLLTPIGWDLTYIDTGASNIYNTTTVRAFNGPTSLYLYGQAQNPGPRGARNEISQRVLFSDFSYVVLIGNVFVEQCASANTYPSWAGISLEFFNENRSSMGKINYQFASVNQGTEFENEINLYNQLGEWLEFNRDIVSDFNNYIGNNNQEVKELKINLYIVASDGTQAGNTGVTEAFYDNFLLYQIGLKTTTETTVETTTTTEISSIHDTVTETSSISTTDTVTETTTETVEFTTTFTSISTTTPALTIITVIISVLIILSIYRQRKRK